MTRVEAAGMKDPFKVEAYLMAAFLFGIPLVAILLVIVLPKMIH